MDHGGAVVGPLVAAALLHFNMSFRQVFLLAVVPAAVVMIVLLRGVREPAVPRNVVAGFSPRSTFGHWHELGQDFRLLLLAVFIFTLGNSTDAFLLLRLSDGGVPATWTAVLWSFHHVVRCWPHTSVEDSLMSPAAES